MGVGRGHPIRKIRRWYRRLNYLSADRPRTPWSIRVDAALGVTGLLAVVLVLLLQTTVQRKITSKSLSFGVTMNGDSFVLDPIRTSGEPVDDTLDVVLDTSLAGWPLATATVLNQPQVSWTLVGLSDHLDRTMLPPTPLSDQLELSEVIRKALATSSQEDVARFATAPPTSMHVLVFTIVTGIAWILLWLLSLPILGLIGVGEGVAGRVGAGRKARRRKQNRCENCGYDLKGLDFSAACPECGQLLS